MTVPLTPSDCDLRDFQFMPLDIVRLFSSEFHARATDAEWRAGVTLWLKSFHQVPAASLPDDDVQLCRLAELGRDLKAWRKLRAGALHGWVVADDGRLYHPVVAEKANEAWDRKKFQRERSRRASQARWARDGGPDEPEGGAKGSARKASGYRDHIQDAAAKETHEQSNNDASSILSGYQGTGTGIGTGTSSDPDGSGAEAPSDEDLKAKAWRLALRVLMDRGMQTRASAAKLVGKWAKDYAFEHIAQASQSAWDVKTLDPVSYITAALDRLRAGTTEADAFISPTETRQRLWMQDFRAPPGAWREHERGPKPGHPNCRVSPEIQREFGVEPAGPQAIRGAA